MKWIGACMLVAGASLFIRAHAQCSAVDFALPSTACLNQNLFPNNAAGAGTYSWDFCSGDFNNSPTAQTAFTLAGANGRPAIEFAKDGSLWYGFVTGTFSNTLYRLTFANGTNQPPTFTENLGDLSGALNGPGAIRILSQGGLWFGLLHNTVTGQVVKLSFGNHLSNSITTTPLFSGVGGLNSGLAVGQDATQGWVCVLSVTGDGTQFTVVRLGNSLSAPGPSDMITSAGIPNPNNPGDVDLINACGNWFAFATNFGNANIYRLQFGSSLFSNPVIDEVTTLAVANPGRVRLAQEGNDYFLFAVSLDGNVSKLNFGTDLAQSPAVTYDATVAANSYGLALAKESSVWTVLTVSQSNGQFNHVNYPNICSASSATSSLQNPVVAYSQAGNYSIAMTFTSGSGTGVKTKTVTVSSVPAPDIDFTSQNVCVNAAVNFTPVNTSGNLTGYSWTFGDTHTSTGQNPSNTYASTGSYTVGLLVTASNGCQNATEKTLTIYHQPVANFSLPSVSPVCTNQPYLFTNTSSYDAGSNPSWQWTVNAAPASTTQDMTFAFSSPVAQTIGLTASIPGCSNQATQMINSVTAGPLVGFTFANGCQGVPIAFTNTTTGTGLTYSWNFGDGNMSSQISPSEAYTSFGTFAVNLVASAAGGCQNSATKTLTVYTTPQANFSLDLPPFSCSGTPSQFNDTTPIPTDSNLASWTWNFGDPSNGTSSQENPAYTYAQAGPYTVSFSVTTDRNCTSSTQKMVTVAASPSAGFTNTPACVDQPTSFTDTSGSSIQSWVWQMDNSTIRIADPVYVFGASGLYPVQLTVTASNNCVATVTKNINVPVPQSPDFTSTGTCATKPALFNDATPTGTDPTVSWAWNFGGLGTGSGATAQFIFPSTGNVAVTLNNTAQSGCVYAVTKTVSIATAPQANFTMSTNAGAPPLAILFTNTSVNATSYRWHFNDPAGDSSSVASPSFTYTTLGDYVVDLTAFGGPSCSDTFSQVVHVEVASVDAAIEQLQLVRDPGTGQWQVLFVIDNKGNLPLVNPGIVMNISGTASLTQNLSVTIPAGQTAAQSLPYSLIPSGVSFVCVSVDPAGDVDEFNNKQCVDLDNQEVVFSPYPNPASGQLHLDWIASADGVAEIAVYNAIGQLALDRQLSSAGAGLNQVVVDVSNLHSGVYLAVFSSAGIRKTFRFIVN
jgi:PKD repeat protein